MRFALLPASAVPALLLSAAFAASSAAQSPCGGGQACLGCQEATLPFSDSTGPGVPPWGVDLTVPAFDPALGVLAKVVLQCHVPVQGSFGVENLNNDGPCAGGLWSIETLVDVRRVGDGVVLMDMAPVGVSASFGPLAPFDGQLDFRGPSGETHPFAESFASGSCLDEAGDLEAFTAAVPGELLTFTAQTFPSSSQHTSGCGALAFLHQFLLSVDLQVTYIYCPDDPARYCTGTPNSVGPGALIAAAGSTSVSANDFRLLSSGLPPFQSAIFYYGTGATQVPFGDGFRCVAGGILRLPIVQASASGELDFHLDFTLPPADAGAGQIHPGSTWNFQAWYRDPAAGGAGFNLSDALAVPFCP